MQASAAAQCRSPITDRLNWRYAPLDAEVVCTSSVLETIRQEAGEGRSRLSHGGLEIGGILLGRRSDRSIEILGSLPIECEHKLGPLFILSTADEKALDTTLASGKLGALQPVGLYVSHSRSGFAVAETDSKILDRLTSGPWQLVVVVMPAKFGPSRAGFFIRGSVDRSFVCAHEVQLSHMEHPVPATSAPAAAPAAMPDSVAIATPAPSPDPVNGQIHPLQRLLSLVVKVKPLLAKVKRHWRLSQWNMAVSLTLLLLFVSIGGLWVRARGVRTISVPMHVSDLGANLRIEWDPAQKAIRSASRATLEIRDGQKGPVAIPVTRNDLDSGGVLYVPHSDNIEVRLKLMHANALLSESVLYFINPQHHVPAPPDTLATAGSPPASTTPTVGPQISAPVPEVLPEPTVPHIVETRPTETRKPAKTFQLPAVQAARPTVEVAPLNLPDLPDVRTSPPAIPSATSLPLGALLTAPASLAGPPQLRSGRLIWTGALRKNAVLSITSAGPSAGVVSGSLPGVPVKVSLQPAELVDGGIAVYSKDPDQSAGSQPPGAWNGWNVVVYDWDPKRVAEISLVEPPAASNNWKRLVLRNGNRSVSVFVVNWQRF